MTGKFVPPIHRKSLYSLQYSMLPARRVGVGEVWRMLYGDHVDSKEPTMNGSVHKPAMNGGGKVAQAVQNGNAINGSGVHPRGSLKGRSRRSR